MIDPILDTFDGNKYQRLCYYLLIVSIVLSSLYCIITNYKYLGKVGEYTTFTKPIKFNPNFYAILVVLVMVYLTCELIRIKKNLKENWIKVSLLLFFSWILIQLTSRMAMIALVNSFFIIGIYYLSKIGNIKPLLMVTFISSVMIGILSQSYIGGIRLRNVQKHISKAIETPLKVNRIQTMEAGLYLLSSNLITGVGVNKMQSELNKFYSQNKYEYPLQKKYHIHNQFIQIGAIGGLGLLVIFVLLIWLPFLLCFNIFDFLQASIFTTVFMTDSPLMDFRVLVVFILLYCVSWYYYLQRYNNWHGRNGG